MAKRKQYTKEFKLEAVRLANEPDQSFLQVSKNLGISDSALHRWARELSTQGLVAFPGHGKAGLTTEQAEIKRLQRELDIARQERDVLKKAVAFFAKARNIEAFPVHRNAPAGVPSRRDVLGQNGRA
jgi:transposase